MKKTVISLLVLVAVSVAIVSCGSGPASGSHESGFTYRAFVSNPLYSNGTASAAVLNVVDAANDLLSPSVVSLATYSAQPGLMALSSNLQYTAVYSPSGNTVTVVDNATESVATASAGSSPNITLPGYTESLVIASDNATAFAAVPTAPVTGQNPGAVVVMNITTGTITAMIPVAGAHYVIPSPDGDNVLVFSDNSDAITIITTALIGSNENPVTAVIPGFDRPVWAVFNGSVAYVFNCGAECGGQNAGISTFTVGSSGPGATVPVKAATHGMLFGTTLYVAGTPPNTRCSSGSGTCGTLTVVDTSSMSVIGGPVLITDGYHDRMGQSDNGQLFIGAHSCTNTNTSTGQPGCLSILNTGTGKVVMPTTPGDVTGIQPIPGRTVTYVCQGGTFEIFDTTTDEILVQTTPTIIVGQSYDVKLVDPPQSN